MNAACHLINHTSFVVLDYITPYEFNLYGKWPAMTYIKFFGCLCYAYNLHHRGDKFASRSQKYLFLGYSFTEKG